MPVVMKNGTIAFTALVDNKESILSFSLGQRRLRIAEKEQAKKLHPPQSPKHLFMTYHYGKAFADSVFYIDTAT